MYRKNFFGWCILVHTFVHFIFQNDNIINKNPNQKIEMRWKDMYNCATAMELWYHWLVAVCLSPTYELREKNVDTILLINWTSTQTNTPTSPFYKFGSLFDWELATQSLCVRALAQLLPKTIFGFNVSVNSIK